MDRPTKVTFTDRLPARTKQDRARASMSRTHYVDAKPKVGRGAWYVPLYFSKNNTPGKVTNGACQLDSLNLWTFIPR